MRIGGLEVTYYQNQKLIPIYEMYSPLLNDRFYVWSWEEVQMQISKWENEYWGHRGYVFSK